MNQKLSILALILILAMHSDALSQTWPELLQEYQPLFDQHPELEIIKRQQAAFASGQAPAIAAPVIKSMKITKSL